MRRLLSLSLLIALAACGSSDPAGVVTPPPPPPPSSNPPASVAIQAGDGQQAEPAAAVATKPAVLVRDASRQPVSGVTVTFAVDSGGGTISATSAVTGTNGIATAGTWTLGSAEGRNTLKVTVGALAPITIAATAVIVGGSFPAATIGTGGGSINVTQAGPLNGFSITVPGGAFTSAFQATVSYSSNTTVLPKMAVNPVGPVVRISTATTAYAVSPITVHIAVAIPANTFPVIRMYDPATGANESMAPVAWDANGVTGETGHLNSTNFLTVGGGSLRTKGASLSDPGVTIIVDAVPTALLQQDYDSGYRPGVDDWEFGITATANGQVPASAEGPTSLWYFLTKQGPPKLNGRFQQAAGVPLSDRAGLRWIATLDQDFQIDMVNAVGAAIGGNSNAQSDANQFNLIRANFVRDVQAGLPPRPQLVTITNTAGVPLTVVAYRVHGTQLFIYNPVYPGDATEYLEFLTGSAMTPIHLPPFVLSTFDSPLASGATLFLPIAKLPTTYAQVLDGTIGNSIFPTYQLHGWAGRLYDTLFVVDTLRWWVDCPTCAFGFPGVLAVPPVATLGGQDVYDAGSSTSIGFFTTVLANASPAPGTDRPLGAVTWSALSSDGTHRGWLDWHSYVLRRLQTAISPSSLNGSVGVPLSLTFQVAQNLLPSHVNYVWDFGDQQPAVTVVDNPVVQHPYAAAGTYPVTAKIIDVRNNQVIGLATTTATITAGKWQLTAFQQTALVTDPNYAFFEDSKTMNELRDSTIARPAGATLQVFAGGATLPMGIKEPSDFLVRADVNVAAPSMFLSFPRGLPSGGLLAEAVAATGAASSAALTTTPFCGPNCYPMIWINTFTQGGGTGAATYVGSAANWVLPLSNTISCPAPVVTPAKSPVEGYLEINATQSAGGLQGTITFVTPVIRNRTQGGPNICFWDTITEIRRTFTFTAVPAP